MNISEYTSQYDLAMFHSNTYFYDIGFSDEFLKNQSLKNLIDFNRGHIAIMSLLTTLQFNKTRVSDKKRRKQFAFQEDALTDWLYDLTLINHDSYTFENMLEWYRLFYEVPESIWLEKLDTFSNDHFEHRDDYEDIRNLSMYLYDYFSDISNPTKENK